jgi:hypothetical protein
VVPERTSTSTVRRRQQRLDPSPTSITDHRGSRHDPAFIPYTLTLGRHALGGLLEERGWGTDILYGWPGLQDEGEDYEHTEIEVEGDELNAAGDLPDDDAEDPPLDGTRISYQARFDFVIVDEEALHARAEARSREVNPEGDAEAGIQKFGGPLSLLLYLDNPTFRGYEAAGIEMVYGHEVVRAVERTLDEYEYDARDDHFPVE